MSYKKQSNCVYLCHYHLVFATKYRRKIINKGMSEFLRGVRPSQVDNSSGWKSRSGKVGQPPDSKHWAGGGDSKC